MEFHKFLIIIENEFHILLFLQNFRVGLTDSFFDTSGVQLNLLA